MSETPSKALGRLREPFPPEQIHQIPKGGTRLDYVGHAEVTARLLDVDPEWTWEPFAVDDAGLPKIVTRGEVAELWIRLTVAGVTRIGVGTCSTRKSEVSKELIGDALRNAAMRGGVALDLWAKSDLHHHDEPPPEPVTATEAASIVALFDQIGDEDARKRVKVDWVRVWGRPDELPAESFNEAYAAAMDAVEQIDAGGDQ